jgi:hypothetical protein
MALDESAPVLEPIEEAVELIVGIIAFCVFVAEPLLYTKSTVIKIPLETIEESVVNNILKEDADNKKLVPEFKDPE